MREKTIFLKNFIKYPRQIGSIIPSSNRLTNKMIEQVNFEKANSIVELGPGVGCFTEKIMENKKENTRFMVFEKNEDMQKIIKNKFPNIELYSKGEELTKKLLENNIDSVDYIISGLPFTVLEKEIRKTILEQAYNSLKKDGKFVTFQYSLDLYKYLKRKYKKVEVKFVPINIPIAFVYVCTK